MATFKYALRYAPLLLLALILVPWYLTNTAHHAPFGGIEVIESTPPVIENSPYHPGSALYDVVSRSPQESWAVGGTFTLELDERSQVQRVKPTSGIVLHYTVDAGWRLVAKTPRPLFSVAFSGNQDGWAVGYGGSLVHYDGTNWTPVAGPADANVNLNGVAMISASDGWTVGQSGIILHYDGHQWTQAANPAPVTLNSIAMTSTAEGWAVGERGVVLRYQNDTWSQVTVPNTATLNDVIMLSPEEGWATGAESTILHYRAGNWNTVCTYNCSGIDYNTNIIGIAMPTVQNGWIVYQNGGGSGFWQYQYEVWGKAPEDIFPGAYAYDPIVSLNSLSMPASGTGWAVGQIDQDNIQTAAIILQYKGGQWRGTYQF